MTIDNTTKINLADVAIKNINEDCFDFLSFSKALKEIIINSETPFVISINGGWGEGKTSLLNLIKQDITNSKILWIESNAWEFIFSENMNEAFINHIINELIKHGYFNDSDKKIVKKLGLKMLAGIAYLGGSMVVNRLGLSKEDIANIIRYEIDDKSDNAKLDKIINKYKGSDSNNIRENFKNIINRLSQKKIIISIDDLDRINPTKAIEIIETLKNFLAIEKVVFILVVDNEIIKKGLISKFNLDDQKLEDKLTIEKYWDKIIQIPFKLPCKAIEGNEQVKTFVNMLIKEKFKKEYNGDYILDEIINIMNIQEQNFVNGNPRTIKKIVNLFYLYTEILKDKKLNNKNNEIFLYSILHMYKDYLGYFNDLKENTPDTDKDDKKYESINSYIADSLARIKFGEFDINVFDEISNNVKGVIETSSLNEEDHINDNDFVSSFEPESENCLIVPVNDDSLKGAMESQTYICPVKRKFKPIKYIAFYNKGAIRGYGEIINNQESSKLSKDEIKNNSFIQRHKEEFGDTKDQIFTLKSFEYFVNNETQTIPHNYPYAFTQKWTYRNIEELKNAKTTDDL